MRILHITSYQGPDVVSQRRLARNRHIGGSRKVELVSQMLLRSGHEDVVLSAGISAERSGRFYRGFESRVAGAPDGARVLYAAGWDIRVVNHIVAALSSIRRIASEVREHGRFDILLPCNVDEYTTLIVRWYLWRFGRTPLVLQYEDAVDTTGRGTGRTRIRVWRSFEKWFLRRLDGVLAVSPALAERVGHPNSMVLRGAVSESLRSLAERRRTPFSDGPPYLAVYAGSLTAEKGVHRIIEKASTFGQQVRFVICGTGALESQLRQLAAGTGAAIQFTGFMPQPEMDALITSADILLNPHDDEQSGGILPFKLVEYLAAGGAVVTTRSGVREDDVVFRYSELTSPEKFDHGIHRVIQNREGAVLRAVEGQRWALENYSESAAAGAVNEILCRALESHCTC